MDPPRPEPIVITCIIDELPEPVLTRACDWRKKEIEGVAFLRVCPQWIDKMISEAERL